MKKGIGILLLIGGSYLAYRLLNKAVTGRSLNVKVRGLNLNPISKASLSIELINPTANAISFDSIVLDLSVNDYAISTLNYQVKTEVAGNSSKTINIPVKINPLDGLQFITNFLTTKGSKVNKISITGTINSDGLPYPINIIQNLV